ncbi:hypothetical protein LC653_29385 [Nostoc sp. CHAB 5784]|uniref:hypothetical protein n=1 Tax=Nostoc mirabile TaxID=2907820 RepID=UPI001E3D4740|nr:hypothetical protein [Nostoc mirabile]MCC5667880.1 hypothetical protein [Nostoc mirabile CHAB5784]
MLDALQRITLRAFLIALVELDSPLPTDLQHEINKVGEMLANAQNDDVLKRLKELAENDCLKAFYHKARRDIQKLYRHQELNRFEQPDQQIQDRIHANSITNIAIAIPSDTLINIAIAILKASDSSVEAKKHKSEIIPKNS